MLKRIWPLLVVGLVACVATSAPSLGGGEVVESVSSALSTAIQIDCGSTAAALPFAADEDFAGGSTITHANTIDTSKVTNPAPAAVYQTARIGNFTYTIGGFAAGASATVRLHFAETYFSTAGSRVFNVSINGASVLANFDILKVAVKNQAYIAEFTEAANSSGAYVITVTTLVNNGLLSGLEVLTGSTNPCLTNNGGCSPNATCTNNGGTASCTCTSGYTGNGITCTPVDSCLTNNGGCSPNATCTSTGPDTNTCTCNSGFTGNGVTCTPVATSNALQIDCGSTAGVSPFVADEEFAGGSTINHANTIDTSTAAHPAPAAVYQTARIGNFTYTFNGFPESRNATIRLHFAETFFSTAGSRVFDVIINGTTVLSQFDILGVVAKNQAYEAEFFLPGSPSDQYVITFKSDVNNALVSGIEIITGPTSPCSVNNGGCSVNATCTTSDAGAESCMCNCGFQGDGVTCNSLCVPNPCAIGFVCEVQACTFSCK
jgi:hypothetical protein